jgi:mono/diheme cytochrome c family protein
MRNRTISTLGILAVVAVAFTGLVRTAVSKPADATQQERVEHGHYLVTISGCNDCHTPKTTGPQGPEPDPQRLLSGHPAALGVPSLPNAAATNQDWPIASNADLTAWAGPWGISFAINLTPDQDTGIGTWSESMFVRALRTGRHMGEGRPILPPMPWPGLAHLTDDDLGAIFAYLQSIPPVTNAVPDPILSPAPAKGR